MPVTALVCPVCKSTKFIEKGHLGKLLMHCEQCQSSAKVEMAGLITIDSVEVDITNAIYATAKVPKEKKVTGSDDIFEELVFQIPLSVKSLIQAALWCAKCDRGVKGKWYAGTVLGDIMADYLAGFDYKTLPPPDYARVEGLLQEASKAVTDKQMRDEQLLVIADEDRRFMHEAQLQKISDTVLPILSKVHVEKAREVARIVEDGNEKRAIGLHRGKVVTRLTLAIEYIEGQLKTDLAEDVRENIIEHLDLAKRYKSSVELNEISPFDEDLKTLMEVMQIPKVVYIRKKSGVLMDSETGEITDDNFSTLDVEEELLDAMPQEELPEATEGESVAETGIITEDVVKAPRKKRASKLPVEKEVEEVAPPLDSYWQDFLTKITVLELQLVNRFVSEETSALQEQLFHLKESVLSGNIQKAKATRILKQVQEIVRA
jgi:hypothetical protein